MGGKPGSSKGCSTCRRRKKGCDLKHPTCSQCQKAKLICGGYQRETVWVNETQDTVAPLIRSRKKNRVITQHESLTRSAYQERYLGLFWEFYLPNGRDFPTESAQHTTGLWLNHVQKLFHDNNEIAIRKILLAVSLTNIGLQDNKNWMVENGIKMYGSCLRTLAGDIGSGVKSAHSTVLATSRLLSLYEILYGHDHKDRLAQTRNWQLHTGGELGYMISRGPDHFASGFAHQLFVDGRNTQISLSIISREPSVLNEPKWKTSPWMYYSKTAKDLLGDIFAEIPGLLALLDKLIATPLGEEKEIKRSTLTEKCQELLIDWTIWGQNLAPKVSPIIPDTVQADRVFHHLISAHSFSGYWSTGIFLYAIHQSASGQPVPSPFSHSEPIRQLCSRISGIMPTFLHPQAGAFGLHGALFSSLTALIYLNEADNCLSSLEARAFYDTFARYEKGWILENFIENMRKQLCAGGQRMFPLDIN